MSENQKLLNAVLSSNLGLVTTLTKSIENVDFIVDGTDGLTLLHIVSGIHSIQSALIALHLLKNKKADPNFRSYDDMTPVHISTMWNNFLVLEKLLSFGGDPFIQDFCGKNAFELAADNDAKECLELLQLFKANLKQIVYKDQISKGNNKQNDLNHPNATVSSNDQCQDITEMMGNVKISKKSTKSLSYEKTKEWVFEDISKYESCSSPCSASNSLNVQSKIMNGTSPKRNSNNRDVKIKAAQFKSIFSDDSLKDSMSDDETIVEKTNCLSEVETTYTDEEEGIVLVEKHCMPMSCEAFVSDVCSESSFLSDWKSYRTACSHFSHSGSSKSQLSAVNIPSELHNLNNSEIFSQLQTLGDDPGPVMDYVRTLYLRRLTKLKSGLAAASPPKPKYTPEIYMFLGDGLNLQKIHQLEQDLIDDFEQGTLVHQYREGNQRCSFNYFLLDPRVTQNLPVRANSMTFKDAFNIFLDALFYVGKGTRGRPYSHLFESVKAMDSPQNAKHSEKVQHILDIWNSGLGVISLSCFQNSLPVEAYTREACVIEAVGLYNLTNIKKGNFYGVSAKWTMSKKRQLGVLFLSRALEIFLLEGERIIRPKDIGKKVMPSILRSPN